MSYRILLPVLLFIAAPARGQPAEAPQFDRWFTSGTLRVDYHHGGTAKGEKVSVDGVYREGPWPGSRTHLTDSPDYGKYRFRVVDDATGASLFEQGFSTLFGEWQTTDEAKEVTRVFHETVRFPEPRGPVRLEILSRNRKGALQSVFVQRIDPASHLVRESPRRPEVTLLDLHEGAPMATCLDVVIVADGYAPRHDEKARRDLARYAAVLLETPPFDRYRDRICIRGVLPGASASGPDEPRKRIFQGPPAGTTFNTFDSPRYLTTVDNKALRDLAGLVPYDTIYVMVNSSRYGGAGIYNFFSIFVSDNEYDEYVFIHEFGHGFVGLGDEYYSSSVAYSDFYPRGVEPWEPNVTAILQGAQQVKWKDRLTPGVPLPTPEEDRYAGVVGVFEGAGYSAKGLYRPALDCKMFSKKRLDFCPVCMDAVEMLIQQFTE